MPSGLFYAYADFDDRLLPLGKQVDTTFAHQVLELLKRLGDIAERNPRVTLSATVTAGVWVLHRGRQRMLINPGQKYLRVEAAYNLPEQATELVRHFSDSVRSGRVAKTERLDLHQWRVAGDDLHLVWEFVDSLSAPSQAELEQQRLSSNPRYFSADDKSVAFNAFVKGGRWCNGVEGGRGRHKLRSDEAIEYDHDLPHAKGGSNSIRNLQILCAECNRFKSDKLL